MALRRHLLFACLFLVLVTLENAPPSLSGAEAAERVVWNDNLEPAGVLEDGRLRVELEIVEGDWYLVGDDQPPGQVFAFAERGRGASIPGPLIRVDLGTTVDVTITNRVDSTIVLRGLSTRRDGRDHRLTLEPGETNNLVFEADAAGTYYYWGTTSAPMNRRAFRDSQLTGAFVVDEPGARRDDRVLVMGMWYDARLPNGEPDRGREFLVINGRPWPHVERLTYALGDSIRWRLINASVSPHAMHLHGFYYRVEAKGDASRDTIYWADQQRMAVTEHVEPGGTMSIAWSPHRPGGWIFHCHMSDHVVPNPRMDERLTANERFPPMFTEAHHEMGDHATDGMGGLMMGLYVEPPPGWVPDEPKRREMQLYVTSRLVEDGLTGRHFSYVLQDGETAPAADSARLPGSLLLLRKGEPTAIRVTNLTDEVTQVHWHGLEIESYYDGVAGVGGYPEMPTPAIAPGESWEMRVTPERAGSFMYHTHMSDLRQQGSGLYGPLVVLDEGETWDPETDRVFVFGRSPFRRDGIPLMNGENPTTPTTFEVGKTYRLRFMQITLNRPATRILLTQDGYPVRWIPRAHDGFDLPPGQREPELADRRIAVGETYDFEYTPTRPGELRVEFRTGIGVLLVDQRITVRPAGG
ncbi:MAG: multicopper oxidase domain-containing protein [Gemmatimonadota bacterium]|nr:multicopper oxidase domain-containing protein [Gemmatimonadota bacterium]